MIKLIKQLVKEFLYRQLKIPYNSIGLPNSLIKYLSPKQSISLIDVGAYNGGFTASIEKYCGVSQAVLVEPIPTMAQELSVNFSHPKYKVFSLALAEKEGIQSFEVNEAEFTSSLLKIKKEMPEFSHVHLGTTKVINCQTSTVDRLFQEANLKTLDLLKIDVQGAEHLVLSGAGDSLPHIHMIWTEFSFKPLYENSSTFIEIYEMLNSAGFKMMEVETGFRSPEGEILQGDALFINSNFDANRR
jgi:FkbM family methyltransferase